MTMRPSMRALSVDALGEDLAGVRLRDHPLPGCGPGQMLIRMRAASLNHPDLLMTRGAYQLKPELPFVLGMEVAGEVVDAGPDSAFVSGDRVVCPTRIGAFADFVLCPQASARRIAPGLSMTQAAALGAAYTTAQIALAALADVRAGDWVLVHGASGGVGLAAVDLAKALGARVIATSRSAWKRERIADLYAPEAMLPSTGFRDAVKELTGAGADIIFDPVGGDTFDESTRAIAFGGKLLVVGFTSGRIATLPANIALIKGFSVIGVRAGEFSRRFPDAGARHADRIWDMAADGRINPHIHATYAINDWRAAFAEMQSGSHVGKIVITA